MERQLSQINLGKQVMKMQLVIGLVDLEKF
jgi:hypothetical protein